MAPVPSPLLLSGLSPRAAQMLRSELDVLGAAPIETATGALALTFSYPFFMSQPGMEFWLLNAALFSAFTHATALHPHRR